MWNKPHSIYFWTNIAFGVVGHCWFLRWSKQVLRVRAWLGSNTGTSSSSPGLEPEHPLDVSDLGTFHIQYTWHWLSTTLESATQLPVYSLSTELTESFLQIRAGCSSFFVIRNCVFINVLCLMFHKVIGWPGKYRIKWNLISYSWNSIIFINSWEDSNIQFHGY